MSPELKTEMRELRKLIMFAIKIAASIFIIQQSIWAAWVVMG